MKVKNNSEKLPSEEEREVLVKEEYESNPDLGCNPYKRSIEELIKYGVICLNKPSGPTSHQIADYIKKIFNIKKAGHGGTLDPKVTGVLPIALDKATRVTEALLPAGKEYVCLMKLHEEVPEEKIYASAEYFIGEINQLPPVRSAVKRIQRKRTIYYLTILEIDKSYVLFKVGCQAGTYIRKLCHDWGKTLKVGAHMLQLVRTKAGPFNDKIWKSLHDVKDAYEFYKEGDEKLLREIILPMEFAVSHLPKVWVSDKTAGNLAYGAPLYIGGIAKLNNFNKKELVAMMTCKDELIALGKSQMSSDEIMQSSKGIAVKITKVMIERDVYKK